MTNSTGNNPNVMDELGIAHALERDVIKITHDSQDQVLLDIRLFEFIRYDLADYVTLLRMPDAAIHNLLIDRYERLDVAALVVFERFRRDAAATATAVTKDALLERIRVGEATQWVPAPADRFAFAEFVFPAVVMTSNNVSMMATINRWLLCLV